MKPERPKGLAYKGRVEHWENYADEIDAWLTGKVVLDREEVLRILKEAKRRWAPGTTNSDADMLIAKIEAATDTKQGGA